MRRGHQQSPSRRNAIQRGTPMRILSTALVLAAASLAVPAAAGEASKGRASVSYSDLDLDTEAGRVELGKRFEQAARDMCGVTSDAPTAGAPRM